MADNQLPSDIDLKVPARGPAGKTGPMPVISIGKVSLLTNGSTPTVTVNSTAEGYSLNFGIPQGKDGKDGKDADNNAIEKVLESYVDSKITELFAKAKADAQATSSMNNPSINNLIANSSSEWITEKDVWNKVFPKILVKKGESYTFTAEIKDNSSQVALAAVLYDDKGNVLEPNYDGDAPIYTGNIPGAYVISSYSSSGGKMKLTFKVRPTNCKYVDFRIVSYYLGDFTYRNPIAFKETPL